MEHPKKVLGVTFLSHDQASEFCSQAKSLSISGAAGIASADVYPGSGSYDPPMWDDELSAVESQLCIEAVRVVGVIGDRTPKRKRRGSADPVPGAGETALAARLARS